HQDENGSSRIRKAQRQIPHGKLPLWRAFGRDCICGLMVSPAVEVGYHPGVVVAALDGAEAQVEGAVDGPHKLK
ncbi:hypothetical protein ACFL59_07115, partial [Planctomycetota bacterium]